MNSIESGSAVCVFTGRGLDSLLADGGSRAWVLDAKRARACDYVVCVQNRDDKDDWGQVSAPHKTAFVVGKLKDVVRDPESDQKRWILVFSEYAEIDIADAWPGYRNPVFYTDLNSLNIDVKSLDFHAMPEQENAPASEGMHRKLTITEAKEGLALNFGVSPSAIEITVRA
jgi:hypothetical protein